MTKGNWDDIVREYNNYLMFPHTEEMRTALSDRFDQHVREMLRLIPIIRQEVDLTNMIPFASHTTLVFQSSATKVEVSLWYEGNDLFLVYLYHPAHEDHLQETTADRANVIANLNDNIRSAKTWNG